MKRRTFLQLSTASVAALVVGCSTTPTPPDPDEVPTPRTLDAAPAPALPTPPSDPGTSLSAWVTVHADGLVSLTIPEAEMGQGTTHALALVVADELGVPFEQVRVRLADADARFGSQSTGGSSSIRRGHDDARAVAAAARELLVAAAAARTGVEAKALSVKEGAVVVPDGEPIPYADLVADAAKLPAPESPTLKPVSERTLATDVPRWDLAPKVRGEATYGLDVRVPDMLFAALARPPVVGQTLAAVGDVSAARAVPGVVDVVEGDGFVAVLAKDTWTAFKGRDALSPTWEGGHPDLSTASVRAACEAALSEGVDARKDGDAAGALAGAETVVEATFEAPFLAHAAMEPLSCTARVTDTSAEVWVATQAPTRARQNVAAALGLAPEDVTVRSTFLGGGFGRRSNPDYIVEAALVAKAAGRPVQLVWSREEDIRGGRYRPFSVHRLRGGLDASGRLVAWEHALACPSILESAGRTVEGVDGTSVEGARNVPYAIPNVHVTAASPKTPVSLWFWRSVGSSQNAWVTECFIDELAHAAGADPVAFRRTLLAEQPRHARVLAQAADKAGWGSPLPEGRARGVAVHESFGSFCAQVAEVSLVDGQPRVHKVTCVVDVGQVVTPDAVEAQMQGAIVYGLSAALWGRIDLEGGQVVQSNFSDHRVLRYDEMPEVDVTILADGEPFGGVGEPGTPPIAPAVCNALRVLTGEPVRTLPIVG